MPMGRAPRSLWRLLFFAVAVYRLNKLVDILKGEVDTGEAHPGDAIESAEFIHHQLADHTGADLTLQRRSDVAFDAFDDGAAVFTGHRPFLTGALNAAQK